MPKPDGQHCLSLAIANADDTDWNNEVFPITDAEYRSIADEPDLFVFPLRLMREIEAKYPGRWFNSSGYILDDEIYYTCDD